jgi:hypothetical protein
MILRPYYIYGLYFRRQKIPEKNIQQEFPIWPHLSLPFLRKSRRIEYTKPCVISLGQIGGDIGTVIGRSIEGEIDMGLGANIIKIRVEERAFWELALRNIQPKRGMIIDRGSDQIGQEGTVELQSQKRSATLLRS